MPISSASSPLPIACDNRDLLERASIALWQPLHGSKVVLGGIAPDGYTRAQVGDESAPVRDNVFELVGVEPEGGTLVLTGPDVARREVPLLEER